MVHLGHYTLSKHTFIRLGILFGIFLITSIGFVALADEVHEGETLAFDQSALTAINEHASPYFDTFFVTITQLGGVIGVVAVTLGLLMLFLLRKAYRSAIILAAGVGGAAAINLVLKAVFERARPDLWEQLVVETSFSFPSGHAMASAALAVSVAAIFWHTKYRWLVVAAATLYGLIIGFSRLYLGVHYPTDIVAGWLVSTAWVLGVVLAVNGWRGYRQTHHRDKAVE